VDFVEQHCDWTRVFLLVTASMLHLGTRRHLCWVGTRLEGLNSLTQGRAHRKGAITLCGGAHLVAKCTLSLLGQPRRARILGAENVRTFPKEKR
jgi:hypothetical protein